MAEPLLAIKGLNKHFGGVVATQDLYLDIMAGEAHAIIGPNGAGKTTLIGELSGTVTPDSGAIEFAGVDITGLAPPARSLLGMARTFQITSLFMEFTALDNVALAVQAHDGPSFGMWDAAREDVALSGPARAALVRVGLETRADVPAGNLAHGEQRQLEIAMALATNPSMLLLDEPMAGMGAEESRRMVALLAELKGAVTILLIEHDMDVVFALADRITVLSYGRAIATGSPEEVRADAGVREAYLGDDGVNGGGGA